MTTLIRNDKSCADTDLGIGSDLSTHAQAIDEVLSEMLSPPKPPPITAGERPTPSPSPERTRRDTLIAYQPMPRSRAPLSQRDTPDWIDRVLLAICLGSLLVGAVLFYRALPPSWRGESTASNSSGDRLLTRPIQDVRVGDRLIGRNPIREQAEKTEPDPATWRQVSLSMKKANGLGLWIELLRPLHWIEQHGAVEGNAIFIDLPEMGAVGDAEVTKIGPCPVIRPGKGTVVTGTFKHEADESSNVVSLRLEGQSEATGVTANHFYWSADRQEFVEVGQLRSGELVDTEFGLRRVLSATPKEYVGLLYNVETTEHVFRVGSLGTLVHNSCVDNLTDSIGRGVHVTNKSGAGAARPPRHHIFPQENRQWFSDRRFDIDRATVQLDQGTHSALHTMG